MKKGIRGGNFYSEKYSALYVDNTNSFLIEGGTFTNGASDYSSIYVYSRDTDTVVSVKTAKFVNTSGYKAIEYDNNNGHVSSVVAMDGYFADPADWETINPSQVEFKPITINVTFNVEGNVWKQIEAKPDEFIFPENPIHSQSYDFLYWELMQKDLTLLYQIKGDVDKVMRETHPEMLHTDKTKETTL